MSAMKLTITMNEQGQIQVEGPAEVAVCFLLIEAAREITMRRFMPEKPPSQIVVPALSLPGRPA